MEDALECTQIASLPSGPGKLLWRRANCGTCAGPIVDTVCMMHLPGAEQTCFEYLLVLGLSKQNQRIQKELQKVPQNSLLPYANLTAHRPLPGQASASSA